MKFWTGAVALADPHQPEVLELLERLAQRRAIDPQALRQLALRRQLRTRGYWPLR